MRRHRFATRGKRREVRTLMLNDSFQEGQAMHADYRVSLMGHGISRLELYADNRDRVRSTVRFDELWEQLHSGHYDHLWIDHPMPEDYTCGCGLYVHPAIRNPEAIHIPDCSYAEKA